MLTWLEAGTYYPQEAKIRHIRGKQRSPLQSSESRHKSLHNTKHDWEVCPICGFEFMEG